MVASACTALTKLKESQTRTPLIFERVAAVVSETDPVDGVFYFFVFLRNFIDPWHEAIGTTFGGHND